MMQQQAIKLTKRELFEHYMSVRSRMNSLVKSTNQILAATTIALEEPQPLEVKDENALPYASANKIKMIAKYVAATYGITPDDIYSARRTLKLVEARHIVAYVARNATLYSYPQIGRCLNRDHSTIIHSCQRIEDRVKQGGTFALAVQDIVERFKRND